MIRADGSNQAEIMAFLQARTTNAMFPIVNLRDHGMDGPHPKSMSFWLRRENGTLADVLGVTKAGTVLPVWGANDLPDVTAVLTGKPIFGILGQVDAVADIHANLQLPNGDLHRTEPHLELDLGKMILPDATGLTLIDVGQAPRATMITWRTDYGVEALNLSPQEAMIQAITAVDCMVATGSNRVLLADGQPVAITGFNTILTDTVMIGGVYTPSALRGRGYARAAVAMHLNEAQGWGIKRAVLSAANTAAIKAYRAIGFTQVGEFMIIFYTTPQVAHV